MAKLARWCFRHKYLVILIWLALWVAGMTLTRTIGTNYSDNFTLPSTDSTKALDLLKTISPGSSGETDNIVIHTDKTLVTDQSNHDRVEAMIASVLKVPQVESVVDPYTPQGVMQISRDQKTAYIPVNFSADFQTLETDNIKEVIKVAQKAATSDLQVELGGSAIEQTQQTPPSSSEALGVAAAAVILLIAFGSLLAMAVPIITALIGLGVGLSTIGLLSHSLTISTFSPTLGALIGLGVGIDYALFVITRYRLGLLDGLSPEEATVKALNTAGRAVIFAGGTVCVALLGLISLRINFLGGIGVAASGVVLVTVLAAITLLPAVLGVFKMRVLSRRMRRKLKKGEAIAEAEASNFWAKNARFVERHSWQVGSIALAAVFILMIPFFSLRLGSSDAGNDPPETTTRKAYDILAEGFGPGFNGPLQIVASINNETDQATFDNLADKVKTVPGVAAAGVAPLPPETKVGIIQVVPTTSPESKETGELIKTLRGEIIPNATNGSQMKIYVGGITAIFDDFADVIKSKLPLFLGVIIGLGFLILMVAFRSLAVPLTAAAMNLLAAGASFGVVVAIFQWGWLSNLLHTGGAGPVEAFLPVIMLAILFGLSMDYQVFLVSRMHEEWVHTKNNKKAVTVGQTDTGRVITAAATIMIFVFSSFVLGGQRVIAEFGVGLAVSVLIDAFIIRNFLVPAVMHWLGKANWWLPSWLDRALPHVAVEPVDEPTTKKA